MTCLQLCVLFNFQIWGTFPPVFMNIFLRSRLTLYKCVVSAFIQRSWRIRNWTIQSVSHSGLFLEPSGICKSRSVLKLTSGGLLLKKAYMGDSLSLFIPCKSDKICPFFCNFMVGYPLDCTLYIPTAAWLLTLVFVLVTLLSRSLYSWRDLSTTSQIKLA